jgi:hypothetical protein
MRLFRPLRFGAPVGLRSEGRRAVHLTGSPAATNSMPLDEIPPAPAPMLEQDSD